MSPNEDPRHQAADGAPSRPEDRPVGELIKELSDQTTTLIRKEMELARAELTQKGKAAGIGAGLFGGAGLLGLFAFGALTAFLILLLAKAIEPWLAALIVALIYAAGAGVLALVGRGKVKDATPPAPEQAIESTKEDVAWTKRKAQAARK